MKTIVLFLCMTVSILSCRHEEGSEKEKFEYIDLPEKFETFYQRFHTDSAFQMEHIVFPLSGKIFIVADTIELSSHWQKEEWKLHQPFDERSKTFKRQFIFNDEKLITEYIYAPDYGFYMERRFALMSDGWNLIFFADMKHRK